MESKPPKKRITKAKVIEPIKEDNNNDLINFYELDAMVAYKNTYHNPNYNKANMPLSHPFRACIIGSSGSMKTNCALNIISKLDSTFEHIDIFTQNRDEPLYNYLTEKIPDDLDIHEGLKDLNENDINNCFIGQSLCIFDDLCLEKDQKQIEEMYIRGRKLAQNKGVSCIYLSQVYFKIPRPIRLQSNIIMIKKIGSNRDIKTILGDRDLNGLKPKELLKMYEYCVKDDEKSFLYIDISTKDVEFRKGFNQILNSDDFKEK